MTYKVLDSFGSNWDGVEIALIEFDIVLGTQTHSIAMCSGDKTSLHMSFANYSEARFTFELIRAREHDARNKSGQAAHGT